MKITRLIFFTTVAVVFLMTGCKSEGWQAKEAYDKVLKMYDKEQIKEKMTSKDYYDSYKTLFGETIDTHFCTKFSFGSTDAQKYKIYVFKKKDDSRGTREDIEKELNRIKNRETSGKTDIFIKDNILVVVPKNDNPKLEQKVYDLFMSYVK